ncbi:CRISPR-associated protein Cas5 [Rugamonas rubra]|uniref:CRISPR-associated protein Cas5 n=1 Tax=Rugamonas rubra TaxID=758825 RepID=UPI003CCC1ACB
MPLLSTWKALGSTVSEAASTTFWPSLALSVSRASYLPWARPAGSNTRPSGPLPLPPALAGLSQAALALALQLRPSAWMVT